MADDINFEMVNIEAAKEKAKIVAKKELAL